MGDFFLGEIRMFAMPWAPADWALCDGAEMSIQQNNALYSLLGNRFGGDGKSTFKLPDLRGRTPVAKASQRPESWAGEEAVTLTPAAMPAHNHALAAVKTDATANNSTDKVLAKALPDVTYKLEQKIYGTGPGSVTLNSGTISSTGGNQPHSNIQPFIVVNFCISIKGTYPPRS